MLARVPHGRRALRSAAAGCVCAGLLAGCVGPLSGESGATTGSATAPTPGPVEALTRDAGAGSRSRVATPAPTPTATATPSRRSAAPRRAAPPRPAAVPGYGLRAAPTSVTAAFTRLARVHGSVLDGVTVRSVRRGSTQVATLILLGVDPTVVDKPAAARRILPGIVAGMSQGAKVGRLRMGSQELAVSEPKGATLVAWFRKGVIVLVVGGDERGPVVAYSTAYVRAS